MWRVFALILCGALIGGALRGLFTGRITAAYKPIGIVRYTRLSEVSRTEDPVSFWLFAIAYLAIGFGGIFLVLTRPELFVAHR